MQIQTCLQAASAAVGFAAAIAWIRAATVIVPFPMSGGLMYPKPPTYIDGDVEVLAIPTMKAQSRWNKWASGITGVAAFLQSVSFFFG